MIFGKREEIKREMLLIFGKSYTDEFFKRFDDMSDMDFDTVYDTRMEIHNMTALLKEGKKRKENYIFKEEINK